MWNIIKTAATAVWDFLKTAWQTFVNGLMSILNTFGQTIQNAWSGMWNIIKTAATAVWDFLKTAWQTFVNGLMSILNTFGQTIQKAWSGMWNIIKTAATAVWDFLKSTWQNVVDGLMGILNRFGQTFQKAWSGMWDIVKGVAKNIWNGIAEVVGGGVNACITVMNGIIKAWDAVVDAVGLKSLHLGTVDKVSIPKFEGGGIVVPMTFASGGMSINSYAARHNQRSGDSTFGDLRQGGALPGYKPGKDTVPAMLSPGEGVLVPEAVRALGGSSWVHWANHEYSNGRGGKSGMYPGGRTPGVPMPNWGFATGGVVGTALSYFAGGGSSGDNSSSGGAAQKKVDPNSVGNSSSPALGNSVESQNAIMGGGSSKSITELISDALGLVIPGGSDSTLGKIVHGIANAAAGFFGGGVTGTILGFIGEKAIGEGFKLLETFADKGLKGKFGNVGNVMDAGVHKILDGLKQRLIDEDNKANQQYMAMAVSGSASVAQWAPVILQALALAGAPASWLGPISAMMQQESGGNPNIVNNWDSNAKAGTPSMGLMQVIGPTFTAYHQPGTSMNILDPIANIAAAVNYIQARYGYPPGSPYANGTTNATPGVHLVGENGPEMVMFGGGETVKTAGETSDILNGGGGPGQAASANPIDQQKLAQNTALWKQYMKTIQATSDTAWKDVSDTANTSWSGMQSSVIPFASGLAKAISDSGNAIVSSTKNTWSSATSTSSNAWSSQRAAAVNYNTDLQKTFAAAGNAIQTKWATDWTTNKDFTQKTWTDQKAQATQFSADLQKTYEDMGTAVGTNWKNTLTGATADTTKYWSDTKAQYTQGTSDMQTGFITPVTTMMDTDLPNAFNASVTAIGTGWENLKTTVREPVAAVVDVVFNQGIVAMWNAIAGTFDAATLDTFTMPGFAVGGAVSGAGTGTSDSITARLSHGEHVWTAAEVAGAGGHANVAALRQAAVGGSPVRGAGGNGRYATGGAVGSTGTVGAPQGGSSAAAAAVPTGADALTAAAGAALGSIKAISNPFIEAAGAAGKEAIAALLPDDVPYKALLNNMTDQMVGTVTSWISANDVAPVFSGGANVAAAQAWADSQVGKPYGLGGDFVNTIDCSQFQSGIARVILGETPAPWFTTFAFVGDTAPAGFEQGLEAPYMVGITNVGVGHMAGTINGKNYEATPPAVRSGPSARGYNDPMFTNQYGFRPSIAAAGGAVTDSNHLAIIDAALSAAGVPPPGTLAAWESGLNTLITRESNWDPNAINNYDSNAAAGTPSQGLAQVIPPTFAAYHVAGTSNNILDPIANVAAAIRYIVSVYGDISNVQQANPNLPPAGYYGGTRGAQAGWHTVGERGPEWVKFRGGEEVLPNGTLPPGGSAGGGVNVSIPITVQGNMDSDAYNRIENELVPKLRRMLEQRRGK
jgi:SLT domain-containing protein